jgi:hypothetical protein
MEPEEKTPRVSRWSGTAPWQQTAHKKQHWTSDDSKSPFSVIFGIDHGGNRDDLDVLSLPDFLSNPSREQSLQLRTFGSGLAQPAGNKYKETQSRLPSQILRKGMPPQVKSFSGHSFLHDIESGTPLTKECGNPLGVIESTRDGSPIAVTSADQDNETVQINQGGWFHHYKSTTRSFT